MEPIFHAIFYKKLSYIFVLIRDTANKVWQFPDINL